MSTKKGIKTTLTPEQYKFAKENKTMTAVKLSKILGITEGSLSYNRWVIRESEKPPVPKNMFDIETYCRELTTI